MSRTRAWPWSEVIALAALFALSLIFFWKIAFTNRILAGLDVFAYFYPYRDYVSEMLRSTQIPLWNPYLFMGAPLLANSQAAVLYPLHWPLIWLSTPKQIAWSIVLHVVLAGTGTYLFGRRVVRLGRPAAWIAAVVFSLGGFLGAQVEHLNQLNASAWLPWLLLCLELSLAPGRKRGLGLLGGALVVALSLLAGHTQASYIVVAGGLVYAALLAFRDVRARPRGRRLAGLRGMAALVVVCIFAVALAAAQLLPTLELSRLSVRSGGLPYNEAASFSLKPALVFKAFLPPYFWEPPFSEYVAYIGLTGLLLAFAGGWLAFRRSRVVRTSRAASGRVEEPSQQPYVARIMVVLAALGVFLALGAYNPVYYLLYKIVPGFSSFRAPARWLLLYGFAMAILVGVGVDSLRGPKRWLPKAAVALLVIELLLARRPLAYNNPSAPAAYDSMRTAQAHLLADGGAAPFRFLSISDIQFDPGDMADLQAMYGTPLGADSIYDLIVATKMKEVLAFNLPLGSRLYSVDGYDGGLLPTTSYVALERLFLPEDQIWPDGRLRQQLGEIPPNNLLSLLNVKYIITDKLRDVWIDDAFYDLQHTVSLGEVTLDDLPSFETTHLGIVSYLDGAGFVPQGTPVAEVTVISTQGSAFTAFLRAGVDTAEGRYVAGSTAHDKPRIGHSRASTPGGDSVDDYVTVLDLGQAVQPARIVIRSLLPAEAGETLKLRGLTLIDSRSKASRNVSVHPAYRLVHSGDVKIYENVNVLPRAFVAFYVREATDEGDALALMGSEAFDPAGTVILAGGSSRTTVTGTGKVELLTYGPERIELDVTVDSPANLVLTDAYYPGWRAEVDGKPATIQRADLYFRSVALDEGSQHVVLYYRPNSVRLGLGISLGALVLWLGTVVVAACRIGRRRPSSV